MRGLTCRLLVLALSFGVSANARATTYNFADYPANQHDEIHSGIDTISGTIVTDGTMGTWYDPSLHILGGSLTFNSPVGSFTCPLDGQCWYSDYPTILATPTQLLVPTGYVIDLGAQSSAFDMQLSYYHSDLYGTYYCGQVRDSSFTVLAWFGNFPLTSDPGSIAANESWVIATAVPEPSTFALLGIGAIGLLVWWRRQAA